MFLRSYVADFAQQERSTPKKTRPDTSTMPTISAPLRRLSSLSIPQVAESKKVAVPKYDRTQVTAGILHIGVGNFHRAHLATYMDDLLNDDFDSHREWGIGT